MAALVLKTEIPVDLDKIVDGRTVVHEFALEGDDDLCVGDHVALLTDCVSVVALAQAIDAEGYLHLTLR